MRVLFTTIGSLGDYLPLVEIARELRLRGHEIVFAGNAHFQPLIERNNFRFVKLGSEQNYRQATEQSWSGWDGVRNWVSLVEGLTAPVLDWLVEEYQQGDLVVTTGWCFGARIAREILDTRLATVHIQPDSFITSGHRSLWRRSLQRLAFSAGGDLLLAKHINAVRRRYKLPSIKGVLTEWWHSPDVVLGLFPAWFEARATDWPANTVITGFPRHQPDSSQLDADLAMFLADGEPPIVFTRPSWMKNDEYFYRTSCKATRKLGRRAIFTGVTAQQIGVEMPDDMLFLPFAPFPLLLPHTAALVHHGGIGSVAAAAIAGIPQLILPATDEQRLNGLRICDRNLGEIITQKQYEATSLAQSLQRLVTSSTTAEACATFAKLCRADGAVVAANHVEALGATPSRARTESVPTKARAVAVANR